MLPNQPLFDAFAQELRDAGLLEHGHNPAARPAHPDAKPESEGARPLHMVDWNPSPDPRSPNVLKRHAVWPTWRPWALHVKRDDDGQPVLGENGKPVREPKPEYAEPYQDLLGKFLAKLAQAPVE